MEKNRNLMNFYNENMDKDKKLSIYERFFIKWIEEKFPEEEFINTFHIYRRLETLNSFDSIEDMKNYLWNDEEKIALIQAFIFKDHRKINWKIWQETFDAIKNLFFSEKEKWYTLNKMNFQRYFAWENFSQMNIWNCYILSVIDGMTKLDNYEDLIRKSIKIDKYWNFEIKLPLWDKNWKIYKIEKSYFDENINIYGNNFDFLKWKDWIKALVIAYWEMVTWKKNFDILTLTWWRMEKTYNSLIHWINSYTEERTEKYIYPFWLEFEIKNENFVENFEKILKNFNPKKQILNIWVFQLKWYNELWDLDSPESYAHALNVEKVFYKNNNFFVKLSNPHDASKSYDIDFEILKNKVFTYNLWSFEEIKHLKNIKYLEKDNRENYIALTDISLSWIIQKTWKIDYDLISKRWNTKIRWLNDSNSIILVNSYWKDVLLKKYNEKITFDFNWKNLDLKSNVFSDIFWNEKNENFKFYLYAPRLSVFINRVSTQYLENNTIKNPFSLSQNWNLIYSWDLKDKWFIDKTINSIFHKNLNILKVWEKLWINNNDLETKTQIVNFLNNLS